ncbi:hypothetical protein KY084_14175 [Stakelama sp. CBK3Z-3]|uniref:Uncharacterized protein n=1 Tax=Stakelama flava TaxID=2860338 RepID=A0ABS6XQ55_9SPHN|nr:hypothetical protein [Stakelama flava]
MDIVATRLIAGGAAMLASSVLADSGLEHYRGSFANPTMVLPLGSAALSIAVNARRSGKPESGGSEAPTISHVASTAVGLIGLGFHVYNVTKRPGGLTFTNLFYGAPVGAPASLVLSGMLGGIADRLSKGEEELGPIGLTSGRAVGGVVSVGILGTVGEAALLHFRGAYHDPFMWLPVTLPPIAAISLGRDVIEDTVRPATTVLLAATAVVGILGVGFHAYGVARNMGGFRNWRQNILAGPPIPAPPAFTGLAIAGLGALLLMKARR